MQSVKGKCVFDLASKHSQKQCIYSNYSVFDCACGSYFPVLTVSKRVIHIMSFQS